MAVRTSLILLWNFCKDLHTAVSCHPSPRQRNFWKLLANHRERIPHETYDYVFSIVSAAVIGENPRLFGFDFDNPLVGSEGVRSDGAQAQNRTFSKAAPAEPLLIDRRTGRPLASPEFELVPGPAATEATKARLAARAARLLGNHN